MTNITLQSVSIYPIKSTSAIQLSTSWVEEQGLAFDRRFMIATNKGEMLTARTEPRLCLIQTNLTANGINITAPGMPVLAIEYVNLSSEYQAVTIWNTPLTGQKSAAQYNQWFSQYLNTPCQLLFFGKNSERFVKNKNSQVGFADGYPLLLISQQSLIHLNKKLATKNRATMAQFRPNLVVDGCNKFDEDTWKRIKIGEVEFELTSPCSRCVFTTINPKTAEKNSQQEPLQTLKSFRQVENGDVMFGQNLVALNEGQIKNGDRLYVIEAKKPPIFIMPKIELETEHKNQQSKNITTENKLMNTATNKPKINFSSWNKEVIGNNKEVILDQGEDAGLMLPYSCRGGMCGRCKIKLESGDVRQVATDGLSAEDIEAGYVLACSAIPTSDIVLSKPSSA